MPVDLDRTVRAAVRGHFARTVARRAPLWRVAAAAALLLAASILATSLLPRQHADHGEPVVRTLARAVERQREEGAASPALHALLAALVAVPAHSGDRDQIAGETRFTRYALHLDGDVSHLAAWYVEVSSEGAIVGIEGGDPPGSTPATYDPQALAGGRIRLARLLNEQLHDPSPRVATLVLHESIEALPPSVVQVIAIDDAGRTRVLSARLDRLPDPVPPASSIP